MLLCQLNAAHWQWSIAKNQYLSSRHRIVTTADNGKTADHVLISRHGDKHKEDTPMNNISAYKSS